MDHLPQRWVTLNVLKQTQFILKLSVTAKPAQHRSTNTTGAESWLLVLAMSVVADAKSSVQGPAAF